METPTQELTAGSELDNRVHVALTGHLYVYDYVPAYSTNMGDAWQAVEIIQATGRRTYGNFCFALLEGSDFDNYDGSPLDAVQSVLEAMSPLAICKAVLWADRH